MTAMISTVGHEYRRHLVHQAADGEAWSLWAWRTISMMRASTVSRPMRLA